MTDTAAIDVTSLKAGTRRYTVETLAAGQPRPYADTIHHVRVTMEWVPYAGPREWTPNTGSNPESIASILKGLRCGFTDFTYPPKDREATTEDYFRTRLDWLRNTAPGVWEFHTTSASTD
jgi:hypothetical protein